MSSAHSPANRSVNFGEILFATDFSEVSAMALPYAAVLARRFNSTLCVVHIIPADEYARLEGRNREAALATMHRHAEARVSDLLRTAHFQGIRHEVVFDQGDIPAALSRVVAERGPGLIVLGMHGRHGLHKLLLGSVAEEILELNGVPVLLIGREVTVPPAEEVHLHHILHVVDFFPGARRALHYAALLARQASARLVLLHVMEGIWSEPRATRMSGEEFLRLRLSEEGWLDELNDVQLDLVVEFGSRENRVLEAALRYRAELIVLRLPVGRPELAAHLPGPLAYNVASHARCPVLVVRDQDEQHPSFRPES